MGYVFAVCDGFDLCAPGGDVLPGLVRTGTVGTTPGPYHGQAAVFAGGGTFYRRLAFGSFTSQGLACNLRLGGATWGSTASVVLVDFWLFSTRKQTLVLHRDGRLTAHWGDEAGPELARSAAGAFPMDRWVYLHYSTSLSDTGPTAEHAGGRVDVFLDGQAVLSESGIATSDLPIRQSHFRLGNLRDDGNAVRVEADDWAQFSTFETGIPEPDPPPCRGPHAVYTLRPNRAGDRTELGVGAGTGDNWEVNADALADFDASYVVKAAGGDTGDLYRLQPWPAGLPAPPADADAPDYAEWGDQAWGLLRDDGGAFREGSFLVKYTDGSGASFYSSNRAALPAGGAYTYLGNNVDWDAASLASLQLGWGMAPGDILDALEDAFAASQVALCVWYPGPVAPPVVGGGRRWRVHWIPMLDGA